MANFGNSTDVPEECMGNNNCGSQNSWGLSAAVNASVSRTALPACLWLGAAVASDTSGVRGNDLQGGIVAMSAEVPVPTAEERSMGWQVGEAIVMAEFDIAAQRRLRQTSRGAGMLQGSAQLEPELCRVPLASEYRQGNLDVARM